MIATTADEYMAYSQEDVELDSIVVDVVNMMVCSSNITLLATFNK